MNSSKSQQYSKTPFLNGTNNPHPAKVEQSKAKLKYKAGVILFTYNPRT